MAFQRKLSHVPKLYKVLEDNQSCSGGRYTWQTDGAVNVLPPHQREKALQHCVTGFHLTTNWRQWYVFGRDVYTAIPGNREILVKVASVDGYGDCEDKVVVRSCSLRDRNKDPMANLLKNFYNDVVEQCKKHSNTESKKVEGPVPHNAVLWTNVGYGVTQPLKNYQPSFVYSGHLWHRYSHLTFRGALESTINYILPFLVKSVDSKLTEKERQEVHDIWNLWKQGWIVRGKVIAKGHVEYGKYVVDRGHTGVMPVRKKSASKKKTTKTPLTPENAWPFPRGIK